MKLTLEECKKTQKNKTKTGFNIFFPLYFRCLCHCFPTQETMSSGRQLCPMMCWGMFIIWRVMSMLLLVKSKARLYSHYQLDQRDVQRMEQPWRKSMLFNPWVIPSTQILNSELVIITWDVELVVQFLMWTFWYIASQTSQHICSYTLSDWFNKWSVYSFWPIGQYFSRYK